MNNDRFKFRAWDILNRKMLLPPTTSDAICIENKVLTFCGLPLLLKEDLREDIAQVRAFHPDQLVIMQSTGLKDKNGKLIFEGDIIKHNGIVEQIFWAEGAFWSSHRADHQQRGRAFCMRGTPSDYPHEVEIISNIYENPELLEKK